MSEQRAARAHHGLAARAHHGLAARGHHGLAARGHHGLAARGHHALAAALIGLVRLYQWTLSPLLGPCCRFDPSCSEYAIAAIRRFGPLRGGRLTLRRLSQCHPWGASGYDPVPEDPGKDSPAS